MNSPDSARAISIKQEPEDHPHLDILHMAVCKEERSPSLLQEEPEHPHIKEEQEEIRQRPEEPVGSMLTLLAVKSEDDDEDDISSHCSEIEVELESDTEVTEVSDDSEETSGGVRSQSSQTQFFSCSECSFSFTSQLFLHKHIKWRHNNRQIEITSSACQQISSSTTSPKQGDGPYHCKYCNKCFRESSNLKSHKRVHTGEKPFHCERCDKSFRQSGDLKRHQHIHTGQKPFHCEHCDKSFRDSGQLKTHQRIHTGEKPFHCEHCDKSFSQWGSLNRHHQRFGWTASLKKQC